MAAQIANSESPYVHGEPMSGAQRALILVPALCVSPLRPELAWFGNFIRLIPRMIVGVMRAARAVMCMAREGNSQRAPLKTYPKLTRADLFDMGTWVTP